MEQTTAIAEYIGLQLKDFCSVPGNEYPGVVEFAPFQKIPKKKPKKNDSKKGTIENGKFPVPVLDIEKKARTNYMNTIHFVLHRDLYPADSCRKKQCRERETVSLD